MEQRLINAVSTDGGGSDSHEQRDELASAPLESSGGQLPPLAPTPTHFTVEELLPILPEHLQPRGVVDVQTVKTADKVQRVRYKPTIGLLAKVRTATRRVLGFLKHRHVECDDFGEHACLYLFMQQLLPPSWLASEGWTQDLLFAASEDLHERCRYLSHKQAVLLDSHPLLKPALPPDSHLADAETAGYTPLVFLPWFVQEVEKYHQSLERPNVDVTTIVQEVEAAVDAAADPSPCWPKALAWSSVRCLCSGCGSKRSLYCGKCLCRLPEVEAAGALPPPIRLPFSVSLVLHWQESLIKCTGVHAAILAAEGSVTVRQWQKPRDTWGDVGACASNDDLISNLDPDTDVLLFPLKEATLVEDFAWEADDATGAHEEEGEPNHAPPSSAGAAVRKNLVVLEASWGGGKTMARTIVQRRRRLGLEPIPCVTLPSHVVGKYWKFHQEGNSAVSTIEAISFAAQAAGLEENDFHNLQVLFRLARYKMLQRSAKATEAHKGLPRAIDVRGPWRAKVNGSSGDNKSIATPPAGEKSSPTTRTCNAKQTER